LLSQESREVQASACSGFISTFLETC
jgi:hypothetical protein